MTNLDVWRPILEEARHYPSPHNSQPIKVRPTGELSAEVYYDLDLGLPAENFGIPFAHVCAGVFLESLRVVAAGSGWAVTERLHHDEMDFSSGKRLHLIANVSLVPQEVAQDAKKTAALFHSRRTSRRPYEPVAVSEDAVRPVTEAAKRVGHTFKVLSERKVVDEIVKVNQETLFSDLRNEPVYREILHWLRFSNAEAQRKADGLSAETMLMPGAALKFAMEHRSLWSAPVVGSLIRTMYLNTMRGVRQLGFFEGPFSNPADYIEAGRLFMSSWLLFEANGVYLHPFGTVITNPDSHAKFVKAAHVDETGDQMAWMLFRFGYSKKPPLAYRREAQQMLVEGDAW